LVLDAARLAIDAIEALRSLHEDARWIHLDIKPANILLRRSGLSRPKVPSDGSAGGGNPVLLCDFEHARSIDLLMTKLQEQPAGTIQFRSVRQDLLAIGSQAVHPVPSWYPAPPSHLRLLRCTALSFGPALSTTNKPGQQV
jgi:serine/threonine protein kinase